MLFMPGGKKSLLYITRTSKSKLVAISFFIVFKKEMKITVEFSFPSGIWKILLLKIEKVCVFLRYSCRKRNMLVHVFLVCIFWYGQTFLMRSYSFTPVTILWLANCLSISFLVYYYHCIYNPTQLLN